VPQEFRSVSEKIAQLVLNGFFPGKGNRRLEIWVMPRAMLIVACEMFSRF
jgi:hypothetical protein